MVRMKNYYPIFYLSVKVKISFIFSIFIFFVLSRLYLYADYKVLKWIYNDQATIFGVIPFYLTEIIIAISLSYVLFAVAKMESNNTDDSLGNTEH
jgi:biotin transporter BioY